MTAKRASGRQAVARVQTRSAASAAPRKKRTSRAAKSTFARIEDELPSNLRDYVRQVRRHLNALERDLERAIPQARRRIAKLIREASHELGAAEERGEKAWRERAEHMTRDAQKLLRRLEKAVAPPPRKRTAPKKRGAGQAGPKKAPRRATATPGPSQAAAKG